MAVVLLLISVMIRVGDAQSAKRKAQALAAPLNRIPFKVEVNEGQISSTSVITLAVGQVTVVRCTEAALNILIGDKAKFEIEESNVSSQHYQFYIKPLAANVHTNIAVELPSGVVSFFVQTVAIKSGARVGDYTGEIVIRTASYTDEMAKLKLKLADTEKALVNANTRAQTAADLMSKGSTGAPEKIKEVQNDAIRLGLKAIEDISKPVKQGARVATAEKGKVKLYQVSVPTRTNNKVWVVYQIDNEDSRPLKLNGVKAGMAEVQLITQLPRLVTSRGSGRVALCIDVTSVGTSADISEGQSAHQQKGDALLELVFQINGADVRVPMMIPPVSDSLTN
ncbi:MAG: hypothetical protein ACRD63_01480 [Pyrinomonadaceae bacterium]